jgi:bifunctional UDP-N-acetylglucosamine pyrophosphorylase/glucosamine-1-phosphate N-acetyltransferase
LYRHGENLKLLDRGSIFIDEGVIIGRDVTIYENNRIEGNTVIGDGAVLLPGNYIKNTVIGERTVFNASQSEDAEVGAGVQVGPYARLRPGSKISDNAKIGNFVEIKNASIGEGSKVSHLAYVGDADLGKNCNIGCGVIFVNYNGKTKGRSTVADNCFIGSNCNIIAPVNIEKNSYICAATTVSSDVAEGDFVIGRVRQENKPCGAYRYLKETY